MKKRRFAPGRADMNQKEIVSALEKMGASVLDCHNHGHGMPDLIVGFRGKNHLVEIKNPANAYGRKGLNENQKQFAENWRGDKVHILRTIDDAIAFMSILSTTRGV